MAEVIPQHLIEGKIFAIRGEKVMLDADLSALYSLPTKALSQDSAIRTGSLMILCSN
ncbi:MAG: ORF6N domain-containing protein [Nitrospirae bacterium]|nr:ORF6N domain-containing protein [Nitrospirota bacterium]